MASLEDWRKQVEAHDDAQDKALFDLQGEVRDLKKDLSMIIEGQSKTKKMLKAILAVVVAIGSDNVAYNLWSHAQPVLAPYMTKQFFWFSVTIVMFILFVYGIWIALNSFRKGGKENV